MAWCVHLFREIAGFDGAACTASKMLKRHEANSWAPNNGEYPMTLHFRTTLKIVFQPSLQTGLHRNRRVLTTRDPFSSQQFTSDLPAYTGARYV